MLLSCVKPITSSTALLSSDWSEQVRLQRCAWDCLKLFFRHPESGVLLQVSIHVSGNGDVNCSQPTHVKSVAEQDVNATTHLPMHLMGRLLSRTLSLPLALRWLLRRIAPDSFDRRKTMMKDVCQRDLSFSLMLESNQATKKDLHLLASSRVSVTQLQRPGLVRLQKDSDLSGPRRPQVSLDCVVQRTRVQPRNLPPPLPQVASAQSTAAIGASMYHSGGPQPQHPLQYQLTESKAQLSRALAVPNHVLQQQQQTSAGTNFLHGQNMHQMIQSHSTGLVAPPNQLDDLHHFREDLRPQQQNVATLSSLLSLDMDLASAAAAAAGTPGVDISSCAGKQPLLSSPEKSEKNPMLVSLLQENMMKAASANANALVGNITQVTSNVPIGNTATSKKRPRKRRAASEIVISPTGDGVNPLQSPGSYGSKVGAGAAGALGGGRVRPLHASNLGGEELAANNNHNHLEQQVVRHHFTQHFSPSRAPAFSPAAADYQTENHVRRLANMTHEFMREDVVSNFGAAPSQAVPSAPQSQSQQQTLISPSTYGSMMQQSHTFAQQQQQQVQPLQQPPTHVHQQYLQQNQQQQIQQALRQQQYHQQQQQQQQASNVVNATTPISAAAASYCNQTNGLTRGGPLEIAGATLSGETSRGEVRHLQDATQWSNSAHPHSSVYLHPSAQQQQQQLMLLQRQQQLSSHAAATSKPQPTAAPQPPPHEQMSSSFFEQPMENADSHECNITNIINSVVAAGRDEPKGKGGMMTVAQMQLQRQQQLQEQQQPVAAQRIQLSRSLSENETFQQQQQQFVQLQSNQLQQQQQQQLRQQQLQKQQQQQQQQQQVVQSTPKEHHFVVDKSRIYEFEDEQPHQKQQSLRSSNEPSSLKVTIKCGKPLAPTQQLQEQQQQPQDVQQQIEKMSKKQWVANTNRNSSANACIGSNVKRTFSTPQAPMGKPVSFTMHQQQQLQEQHQLLQQQQQQQQSNCVPAFFKTPCETQISSSSLVNRAMLSCESSSALSGSEDSQSSTTTSEKSLSRSSSLSTLVTESSLASLASVASSTIISSTISGSTAQFRIDNKKSKKRKHVVNDTATGSGNNFGGETSQLQQFTNGAMKPQRQRDEDRRLKKKNKKRRQLEMLSGQASSVVDNNSGTTYSGVEQSAVNITQSGVVEPKTPSIKIISLANRTDKAVIKHPVRQITDLTSPRKYSVSPNSKSKKIMLAQNSGMLFTGVNAAAVTSPASGTSSSAVDSEKSSGNGTVKTSMVTVNSTLPSGLACVGVGVAGAALRNFKIPRKKSGIDSDCAGTPPSSSVDFSSESAPGLTLSETTSTKIAPLMTVAVLPAGTTATISQDNANRAISLPNKASSIPNPSLGPGFQRTSVQPGVLQRFHIASTTSAAPAAIVQGNNLTTLTLATCTASMTSSTSASRHTTFRTLPGGVGGSGGSSIMTVANAHLSNSNAPVGTYARHKQEKAAARAAAEAAAAAANQKARKGSLSSVIDKLHAKKEEGNGANVSLPPSSVTLTAPDTIGVDSSADSASGLLTTQSICAPLTTIGSDNIFEKFTSQDGTYAVLKSNQETPASPTSAAGSLYASTVSAVSMQTNVASTLKDTPDSPLEEPPSIALVASTVIPLSPESNIRRGGVVVSGPPRLNLNS